MHRISIHQKVWSLLIPNLNFCSDKLFKTKKNVNHSNFILRLQFGSSKYSQPMFSQKCNQKKSVSSLFLKKNKQDIGTIMQCNYSRKKYVLNPNQSLVSQQVFQQLSIMRIKSTQLFAQFYFAYKPFLTPRILSIASRYLCSICEKQKDQIKPQTLKKITAFIDDVFSHQLKAQEQEIQKQQEIKNFLFFSKKILLDLHQIFSLKKDSNNFNESLYIKAVKFKNQIINLYLGQKIDFQAYEINELIEIFQELIRFSPLNEPNRLYRSILNQRQKIQMNPNPQFLFSTTNFLLTVKIIEINELRRNIGDESKLLDIMKSQSIAHEKTPKEAQNLRQQCYRLFFNKWLYYFEDLGHFIKLNDLKNIWPIIVLSQSGGNLLLQNANGPKVFGNLLNILKVHNYKFEQLLCGNMRIFSNTFVILVILQKRHPNSAQIKDLKNGCIDSFAFFEFAQKGKAKIRIQTYLQYLLDKKIIELKQYQQASKFFNSC